MKIEMKTKRKIYLFCCIVLGILLGGIANALIEKAYINSMLAKGMVPLSIWSHNCFLPLGMSVALLGGGAALGYVLGVRWWQLVYVDNRHWRRRGK